MVTFWLIVITLNWCDSIDRYMYSIPHTCTVQEVRINRAILYVTVQYYQASWYCAWGKKKKKLLFLQLCYPLSTLIKCYCRTTCCCIVVWYCNSLEGEFHTAGWACLHIVLLYVVFKFRVLSKWIACMGNHTLTFNVLYLHLWYCTKLHLFQQENIVKHTISTQGHVLHHDVSILAAHTATVSTVLILWIVSFYQTAS